MRLVQVPGYHSFLKWAIAGDTDWCTWVVKDISGNSYVVGEILSRKSMYLGLMQGFPPTYNQQWNCWDTMGQPQSTILPCPLLFWGVCCLLPVAWTVAQHCMEGVGSVIASFSLFDFGKHLKPSRARCLSYMKFCCWFLVEHCFNVTIDFSHNSCALLVCWIAMSAGI